VHVGESGRASPVHSSHRFRPFPGHLKENRYARLPCPTDTGRMPL
jgi:hypothetical protein